jgi:hypothetical protein
MRKISIHVRLERGVHGPSLFTKQTVTIVLQAFTAILLQFRILLGWNALSVITVLKVQSTLYRVKLVLIKTRWKLLTLTLVNYAQ